MHCLFRREKSNFSVALISEGKSSPLQDDEYGLRASIKGNRYVVAVSESSASWNAFQVIAFIILVHELYILVVAFVATFVDGLSTCEGI